MIETAPPPGGDKPHLDSLEKKLHVARDHTEAVFRGYKKGFFLYGTGGAGKAR